MDRISAQDITATLNSQGLPFRDSLSEVLGPLIARYHPEFRTRTYPPDVVVCGMLYQALAKGGSLRSAVVRNNADRVSEGLGPASINTAAYSDARTRLDTRVFQDAVGIVAKDADMQVPDDWRWHGLTVKAIDGSTMTANDTQENQKMYPQHGQQEEGAGFPILRVVVLQSLTTGMLLDANFGSFKGKETGEMALARPLLSSLSEGDLLLGDRYYPSFFMMAKLQQLRVEGVFQSHGARGIDFRSGLSLGTLDHIVEWPRPQKPSWMSDDEYESYPETITVREVDVSDQMNGDGKFVIVTTLLDSSKYTKLELFLLYKKRWNIELALRDVKGTMGFDHINANTPKMISKEIWAHLLAYNMLRWNIANAAALGDKKIDEISVATAKEVIMANRENLLQAKNLTEIRAQMFFQLLQCPVGRRPGRIEPRAVKRRPKPRKRLNEPRSVWRERNAA